jgi:hypothetical protein
MLLAKQRRHARLVLQQAICFEAWFGFLFYPISCLLLRDKVSSWGGVWSTAFDAQSLSLCIWCS